MPDNDHRRPDLHEYFMGIAMAVRKRANCCGNKVGAIIVKDGHIVSTGYNGTPSKMPNCLDGGCYRCNHREEFPPGTGYDICICVHAEQNAILAAARFGIAIENSTVYTTMQPCFGCMKEMLQAHVSAVYYVHPWEPTPDCEPEYERIGSRFRDGIHQLRIEDPDAAWAVSKHSTAAK
jgi:dCMP deaminase